MKYLINTIALIMLFGIFPLHAQDDDLLGMLDEEMDDEPMEVAYTFKSTHIINSHTIERMKTGQLDFRVNHRFGEINDGYSNFWGLDEANISLDFGYGLTDKIMVGLRRSTEKATVDGSLKFKLTRQLTGSKSFPLAISYYTNVAVNGTVDTDKLIDSVFTNRLAYTHQLLVARKFNEQISLQLMPTFVHRNLVDFDEENNIYAVGFGGRYKFHRRLALTFEYFWTSHAQANEKYYNPLSLGIDIETGGHVFQLFFSNSDIMEESTFISQTSGSWMDLDIYFGFNISRVFALVHPKE